MNLTHRSDSVISKHKTYLLSFVQMASFKRVEEFPQLKNTVYLDHTGATLPCTSQLERFSKDIRENLYGNPHSRSSSSTLCTETIDQTRFRVLKHFNTTLEKHTVVFTSGCTGALKLLAESFDWSGLKSPNGESSSASHNREDGRGQKRGMFCYLQDNHTSVVGMREIAHSKNADSLCLIKNSADKLFSSIYCDTKTVSLNELKTSDKESTSYPCGLFAYPAQSNFCGRKYPLHWLNKVHEGILKHKTGCYGNWYVVLDAAALASTSPLDLSTCNADFVTISFYKMFGFPTGLGALIVRNDSAHVLVRDYFGGGTVMAYLAEERFSRPRPEIAERLEDGTLPFLDIVSLRHGFDALQRLGGGMKSISEHTFLLAKYVYSQLSSMKHWNGEPICELYNHSCYDNSDNQGPIVNFNLLRSDGKHAGYAEFERLASLHDIHLRTGCFCNTGACQSYLNITDQDIKDNLNAGHVCGDDMDLINGRPTGSVRISFGYMSNQEDADRFLMFVRSYFVDKGHASPRHTVESSVRLASDGVEGAKEKCTVRVASSSSPSSLPIVTSETPSDSCTLKSPVLNSSSIIGINSTEQAELHPLPEQEPSNSSPPSSSIVAVMSSSSLEKASLLSSSPASSLSSPSLSTVTKTSSLLSSLSSSSSSSASSSASSLGTVAPHLSSGSKETSHSDQSEVSSNDAWSPKISSTGQELITEPSTSGAPRLCGIYLYPVKSCGAMEVSEWELSEAGLKYDRHWMIVNEGGVYMSQKRIPHLCLIKPSIDFVNKKLILTCKDKQPFTLPLDIPQSSINERCLSQGKVCGDRVNTIDCGDDVAAWLTEVIGRQCRLQQQDTDYQRACKLNKNSAKRGSNCSLSLANQSQYLLVTKPSSASLLSALQQSSHGNELSMDDMISRFRSNLVIEACGAFEEESWTKIAIGGQEFEVKGCCNRCQMICIDQDTAEKGNEPLYTLSVVRSKKIFFGVHLMNGPGLKEGAKLRTGDKIRVLERATSSETTV